MQQSYNLKIGDLARTMARVADCAEAKKLGHARRVACLAYTMARRIALTPQQCQDLLIAGLFHDVGWALLAPEVARTAGGIDSTPLRHHPHGRLPMGSGFPPLFQAHAALGADFLAALNLPQGVLQAVSHSHECWDGRGSPGGLASHEIPLTAQILSVADHAISMLDRYSPEEDLSSESLALLNQYSKTRLNPEWVDLVFDILSEPDGWPDVASVESFEPLADEAFYPLWGDFIEATAPAGMLWSDLIGVLADRYHPRVRRHAFKVRSYAGALAREMGLDEESARQVEIAANLAEVGRAGLPLPLVFRAGPYTEDERELLRAYPTVSERILEPIRAATPIFSAAITHREKLDGSGYPEGLMGEEIPLGGRIICVSDTYVALRTNDFRRPAYSSEASLAIIQGQETTLFDGLVVDALEAVIPRLEGDAEMKGDF